MDSSRFSTEVYAQRIRAAAEGAASAGLAGLVITPGYDLRYLVGSRAQTFERLTALVLPADGSAPTVVVPRLELAALPPYPNSVRRFRIGWTARIPTSWSRRHCADPARHR
jgi:Xaa-Pro aminopeptidase